MTLDYETWRRNKDRPVYVRGHRHELDALTADDADRVPDSQGAVRDWVRQYDSVVSRQLKPGPEPDGEGGD